MSKKSGKSRNKNYPYTVVEGIDKYVDAALLAEMPDLTLYTGLKLETKLLKKVGITTSEITRKSMTRKEIVQRVYPHLFEGYNFYNLCVSFWMDFVASDIIERIEKEQNCAIKEIALEDWEEIMDWAIQEKMKVSSMITLFRFVDSPVLHPLIPALIEKYPKKYYQETGVKPGEEFQLGELELKTLDETEEALSEGRTEESASDQELLSGLDEAVKVMGLLKQRLSSVGEDYRSKYEAAHEQINNLTNQVTNLSKELKEKEQQNEMLQKHNEALQKQNRDAKKNVEGLESQLQTQKKESGRLGTLVGEIRKEKDDLQQENRQLQSKVSTLEQEKSVLTKQIEQQLEGEWSKKMLVLRMEKENEAQQFEREINSLSRQVEELEAQLQPQRTRILCLEEELQELRQKYDQLFQQPVHVPEPIQDDGEDLEDFSLDIFIDNKPMQIK
ncbi:hypothetical protein T458_12800 [Brevibacillus panacihumi W25]|uniref:Uncharacterized protein n=1 Tax=Brevibacillus panacihumi W25 TaxID=1408254 RepID=V6M9M9_9BACL|nr:hypothetical protein [Brevibacillus panacihumi]EST54570.1 hypothetical protein T458_12800 [Brevibacillus panacihumi W25]